MRSHPKVLVAVASLFAFLALTPIASAAPKTVVAELGRVTGDNPVAGGFFNVPNGIAVNRTGAGGVAKGAFYVADVSNARIQQFNPNGAFVRAWGVGVVSGSGESFEICTVAEDCEEGTSSASAGGISSTGSVKVAVDQVTGAVFVADTGNNRVDVYTAKGNFQGAFGWNVKVVGGAAELQFCTMTSGCRGGAFSAGLGGQLGGVLGDLDVAPAGAPNAGDVFVADNGNLRVEEYKPTVEGGVVTGVSFVRAFGRDVVATGKPNNVSTTAFEVCDLTNGNVAADCKKGTTGTEAGNFGSNSPSDVAVDSEGNVFALDGANKRVQEFSPVPAPITATFGAAPIASTFGTAANLLQSIAVDTSTTPNHLLVAGQRSSAGKAVAVLELDHAGAAVATHGTDLTITESLGLAAAPASLAGYLYVSAKTPSNRIFVLGEEATPTIEAATGLAAESAVLHGQVVSNEAETTYRFELSSDGGKTWAKVPGSEVAVPPAAGSVAVEQTASGLSPNTHYLFRLVSTRPTGGFQFTSAKEGFTTLASPPSVPAVGAVDVSDTSARLVAEIDPNGSPTTYVFKYGTTPSLGKSTSAASAGSGNGVVVLSRTISGLSPSTTYFFQAVATNSAGEAPGPIESFTTRATPLPLPDDRAYEMVSPPDKNFAGVDGSAFPRAIGSWNGEAAAFCTSAQFGEEPPLNSFACSEYLSQRGPGGWSTRSAYGAFCTHDPSQTIPTAVTARAVGFSPNLDLAGVFIPESSECEVPPVDPTAGLGVNLYREDFNTDPSTYDLVSAKPAAAPKFNSFNGNYGAASDDFEHIVFVSVNQQTEDAPAGNFTKLFEWDGSVQPPVLRLVSVKPDGTKFETASSVPYNGTNGEGAYADGVNVVSADGSRIFFQNGTGAASEVYVRENGSETHDVSEAECAVPASCTAAASTFEWATQSGSKAFFVTAAKKIDADPSTAGNDLYMFTEGPDPEAEQNLTLISQDNEPADGASAGVLGLIGLSDDGNTAYFAANGQIVSGGPTGAGPKLYRWRWNGGSPGITYLATLASGERDAQNWSAVEGGPAKEQPASRLVTPDGADLLVQTVQPLVPTADHDSTLDVYRWDEQDAWTCVSCQALGRPSAGESSYDARLFRNPTGDPLRRVGGELRIVMSDDASRVFFGTDDALVPEDANDAQDVYEWHDGRVQLISSGSGQGATFVGASRSGRDAFFTTVERLVGWDTDSSTDIYDARTGGGFPEPPAEVKCEDDACQGTQSPVPAATQPGTVHPSAGNGPSGRKRARCTRRHKAKHKKAHKRAHKAAAKRKHPKAKHSCKRRHKS